MFRRDNEQAKNIKSKIESKIQLILNCRKKKISKKVLLQMLKKCFYNDAGINPWRLHDYIDAVLWNLEAKNIIKIKRYFIFKVAKTSIKFQ